MTDEKNFSDLYKITEDLGKGAFSVVRKACKIETGEEFAAKIINTKRLTARDLQKLDREVRICRLLRHDNIVRLHEVYREDTVNYMIFDLVTGGELFDDIVAREFYSEKDASNCIRQIFSSIAYCHHMGIIHRDIKPENLLLASKKPGSIVKLADFGLAVENVERKYYYGFAGTPGYLSPEVLRKEPYDRAVDIWACGVVLYILLVGYPPFWDDDQSKMFDQIKSGRFQFHSPEWDSVTASAKELITKLLQLDPDKRISAKEALDHPWIKNAERVASTMHRQDTISGLRRFNARRKLKAAMHTARIISRRSTGLLLSGARNPASPRNSDSNLASPRDSNPASPRTSDTTQALPILANTLDNEESSSEKREIVMLTQRVLNVIGEMDYQEYTKLCSETMTAFEPEAGSQIISGLEFHKFYFDNLRASKKFQETILHPKVHILGDGMACIAYTRMSQRQDSDGGTTTRTSNETRVWKRTDGNWQCVHFHRSLPAPST